MSVPFSSLRAVVFDLAGTTVDHGSCAPTKVLEEVFHRQGISITSAQAREPMGKAKRDHIWTILQMPEVAAAWQSVYGRSVNSDDVDNLYHQFLPLQREILVQHNTVIEGVPLLVDQCRQRGLRIGATTGYTRELLDIVLADAEKQGFAPEQALGADDAPAGRPAPYMLFELAKRFEVYPMWRIVKVDDTATGIQAGRNAGCWTVGVTRTGNGVGLNAADWYGLDAASQAAALEKATAVLSAAGAHIIIESVADLMPVLESFDLQLQQGSLPSVCGNCD